MSGLTSENVYKREATVSEIAIQRKRSLWKGLLAGAVAGLVATAAKTVAEKFYPPRTHGEPNPPEALAEKVAGHDLDKDTKRAAGEAIHWGFGIAAGAAYGAAAEYFPIVADKEGATFGLTLMALTHDSALPAMGLSAEPEDQTPREHTSEAASHIVFGVVAERVRSFSRDLMG
jgi:putative membrane protein